MDEKSRKIIEKRGGVSIPACNNCPGQPQNKIKEVQEDMQGVFLSDGHGAIASVLENSSIMLSGERKESLEPSVPIVSSLSTKSALISAPQKGQATKKQDLVSRLKAAEQEVVELREMCLKVLVPKPGRLFKGNGGKPQTIKENAGSEHTCSAASP